jgi:hypothetical protein
MRSVDFLNLRQLMPTIASQEVAKISPPASRGIIERLRPVLNEHGFDGPSSLLVPPKDILDDNVKVLATSRDGQMRGVLFWSNPNAPQAAMFAAKCASRAREFLDEDLGKAVLEPFTSGAVDGRTYVLWPWWQPISASRYLRTAEAILLRCHLFDWLTAVIRTTARQPVGIQQTFANALRHIGEHPRLDSENRKIAERAIARLDTGRWSPCHVLAHNDFWLENILLKPSHPRIGAAMGQFAIIDWGASAVDGYPFYDLIRIAQTTYVGRRQLKREILSHCHLLECAPEDASGYLAAALGHIGLRNDHFPEDRYILLAQSCLRIFQSTLN